ncbi:hypothetical protein EVAR_44293_1 [Eumeta japonica]|uniref:Uncharacterized protein n=1 Tax=Eumeta variegata TaxID=151549 RepID=A0A4C1WRW1_EUMVA|nr:hypothetical protein EVAR_44293_1 [Eumeta japonica]
MATRFEAPHVCRARTRRVLRKGGAWNVEEATSSAPSLERVWGCAPGRRFAKVRPFPARRELKRNYFKRFKCYLHYICFKVETYTSYATPSRDAGTRPRSRGPVEGPQQYS